MKGRSRKSRGKDDVPLEANRLFDGLPPKDRERALAACVRKGYRRGEGVFSIGDPPEFLYLLAAGHVKLVALEEDGSERILHVFRPGDVFGEILLSVERRPFNAVAMDEVRLAILPRTTFLEFLRGSPHWGLNFIQLISERLFTVERDLAALSRTWTRPRLVHVLLRLADNLGEVTPQGTIIRTPLTHETLANMIGTSRVRVTSNLNQLQREGLLSRQGRLLVLRTEGLKGWSGRGGGS